MPTFANALRGDQVRLGAVRALVAVLNRQGPGIPARFVQAAENINAERYLPKACWIAVADTALVTLPILPPPPYTLLHYSAIENALRPILQDYTLQGPERKCNRSILGRVMPRKNFESIIVSAGKASPLHVVTDVDGLLSGAINASHYLAHIPLGNHLIWSTFCEEIDDPDPFRPREPNHVRFIDSLGLYPARDDFYLGFKYNSPSADQVRFPTIADAYGGSFFYGFRPGGRTRPVHYEDSTGRPETVHPVVTGSMLTTVLEEFGPV